MNEFVFTAAGQQLVSRMLAGEATAAFTKVETSDHEYTKSEVEMLTALADVKQEVLISKVTRIDQAKVELLIALDNRELRETYSVKAIGVYARDSDQQEILFGVAVNTDTPDPMPVLAGKTISELTYHLVIAVAVSDQIDISVNPSAGATVEQLEELEGNVAQLSNPNLLINPNFKVNQRDGKITIPTTPAYSDDSCTNYIGVADGYNTLIKISNGNYKYNVSDGSAVYVKASDVTDGYNPENKMYTVDRWYTEDSVTASAKVIVKDDSIIVDGALRQSLESALHEDTEFTLTVNVKSSTSIIIYIRDTEWNVYNSQQFSGNGKFSITATIPNGKYPLIQFDCVDAVLAYAKLECGSVATPFVPSDTATELVKCQRYGCAGGLWDKFCVADIQPTYVDISMCLPSAIRTLPTFAGSLTIAHIKGMSITTIEPTSVQCVALHGNFLRVRCYASINMDDFDGLWTAEFLDKCFFDAEIY